MAAAAALAAGVAFATPAQATPARVAIAGTEPTWADAAASTSQPVTSGTVNARVYLAGQDPAGLASYATAVSTPGNPLYRHYLTPAQVTADYGPSAAQVSAVKSWLTGSGLTVTGAADELGGYVAVTGSVHAAGQAFGVTFGTFKGPDGKTDRAPEQAATAPAGVAGDVLSIDGLDTATHDMTPAETLPPAGPNNWIAPPCSQYYGQLTAAGEPRAYLIPSSWANCGYKPSQIRSAYHVTQSGMTGKGQTVAVVGAYASATILGDANQYAKTTGDPQFAAGQYTQDLASVFTDTAADECDAPSWYSEQTADVEAVHGMAPAANIVYVGASSCTDADLLDALALVVDRHLASIVSASWAEPFDQATLIATYDAVFQAGAAEGIGFFFPAGDHGYESPAEDTGSDQIQTDWPAVSPFVTAVGGTSLAIGPTGDYEWETGWGTLLDPLAASHLSWEFTPPGEYPQGYGGSSGGGVSTSFPQPNYQAGVVPDSLATALPNGVTSSTPMRVIPDVSAVADPGTGFLVGQTTLQPNGTTFAFSLSRTGGTSVATAIFAGIEADAQQAAGHALGFANPLIYQRYGTPAFHDVTDQPFGPSEHLAEVSNAYTNPATKAGPLITDLRTLGINGEGAASLPAVKGYDDATGVGSPENYIQSFVTH